MLLTIIAAMVLIYFLVFFDRPTAKFVFKDGEHEKFTGKLAGGIIREFKDLAKKNDVSGTIKVYKRKSGDKLVFSKSIKSKIQQRFRNVYPHHVSNNKNKKRA